MDTTFAVSTMEGRGLRVWGLRSLGVAWIMWAGGQSTAGGGKPVWWQGDSGRRRGGGELGRSGGGDRGSHDDKLGVRIGEASVPGPFSEGGATSSGMDAELGGQGWRMVSHGRWVRTGEERAAPGSDLGIGAMGVGGAGSTSAGDALGVGDLQGATIKGPCGRARWNAGEVWQQLQAGAREEAEVRYERFRVQGVGSRAGGGGWQGGSRTVWPGGPVGAREEVLGRLMAGHGAQTEEEAWWDYNCLEDEQCWTLLQKAVGLTESGPSPAVHKEEWDRVEEMAKMKEKKYECAKAAAQDEERCSKMQENWFGGGGEYCGENEVDEAFVDLDAWLDDRGRGQAAGQEWGGEEGLGNDEPPEEQVWEELYGYDGAGADTLCGRDVGGEGHGEAGNTRGNAGRQPGVVAEFVDAKKFGGQIAGMVFKLGKLGLGYYRDLEGEVSDLRQDRGGRVVLCLDRLVGGDTETADNGGEREEARAAGSGRKKKKRNRARRRASRESPERRVWSEGEGRHERCASEKEPQ